VRYGLSGSLSRIGVDRLSIGVVVLSLFFDRIDRSLYLSGRSPIPDLSFDLAIGLLTVRCGYELVRKRIALTRITNRELVLVAFLLLVALLSVVSLATVPSSLVNGKQVVKTYAHLVFLAYAAVLIGRAFSRELLAFALKLYFWLTTAAAALAIVEAIDLNAGSGSLTRRLHLLFHLHRANGYKAPISIFSEPAHLGYFCVGALAIGVFAAPSLGVRRAAIGSLLCAVALLLALPVGPLVVAALLAVVLGIRYRRTLRLSRTAWAGLAAAVVLLAIGGLATPVGPAVWHRATTIANGSDGSARYRLAVMNTSIRLWKRAPATGVGLGNTRYYLPTYVHLPFNVGPLQFDNADAYLSILGETGPLGLAGFVALIVALAWPAGRRPRWESSATQLTVFLAALSVVIDGAFPAGAFLWFWLGTGLAGVRANGEHDLFDRVARAAARPRLLVAPVALLLLLFGAGGMAYALDVQHASTRSVRWVTANGQRLLEPIAQPGDAGLTRADARRWAARYCPKHRCRYSLHFVGGRLWQIDAKWKHRSACLLVDLSKGFRQIAQGYEGFSGMTRVRCTRPG
jgi:O-antigen ligase